MGEKTIARLKLDRVRQKFFLSDRVRHLNYRIRAFSHDGWERLIGYLDIISGQDERLESPSHPWSMPTNLFKRYEAASKSYAQLSRVEKQNNIWFALFHFDDRLGYDLKKDCLKELLDQCIKDLDEFIRTYASVDQPHYMVLVEDIQIGIRFESEILGGLRGGNVVAILISGNS